MTTVAPQRDPRPLHGIRVLDLSTVVAGPFGSEILGCLGADVIRIEAPSAAAAPLGDGPAGAPVTDAEGFTWALQRNKRSMVLDLKSASGKAAFLELVRRSDVVYENFRPGVMDRLGLGSAALAAANPGIVHCAISGFGATGPWSTVAAYDAIVQALGGSMSITGTGESGDIPCRLGVPIGDIAGALYAVIGVLAALHARSRSARGRALDISLLDVQLALNTYRVPQTFGSGIDFGVPSPRRGGAGATPYGPFRCADDAWIVLGVASNFWGPFCRCVGHPEWIADPRFATLGQRQTHQGELETLVEQCLRGHDAAHWQELLTAAGVPAARVNQIHEAFAHPQARARQALVAFHQSGGRVVHAAAHPVRWIGEAPFPQRPPVATGADTEAILVGLEHPAAPRAATSEAAPALPGRLQVAATAGGTVATAELAASQDGTADAMAAATQGAAGEAALRAQVAAIACRSGPLAGTLVLEFCGDEPSGTLGTQILADLGATVLKIERPPSHEPRAAQAVEAGAVPRDIAYSFGLNRNKRSLTLDLKTEAGRALALRLAAIADVVIENHKPGVLARLGLGPEVLRQARPALVVCSVSGYGQSGPWSAQPAYDATAQAISGVMAITGSGRPDSMPVRWGNPIGGIAGALYAVIDVLAALHRRARTGSGAWLDVALFDVQLALHAYRVPPALTGRRYGAQARRGGSGALPYGPFLARDGRWFVLAITHQFWAKACEALDHPEWADDPRFATEARRQANEVALNALVGEAIASQDAVFWQERFVARGIPGAPVLSIRAAFDHPQARARGMLVGFAPAHPVAGALQVAGDPIRFVGEPQHPFTPAPGVGADAPQVLEHLLGLDAAERAALRAQRVVWWPESGLVYERPSVV